MVDVGGAVVVVSAGVVVVSVVVVSVLVVSVVAVVSVFVVGSVVDDGESARAAAAAPLPKRTIVASVAISFGRATTGLSALVEICPRRRIYSPCVHVRVREMRFGPSPGSRLGAGCSISRARARRGEKVVGAPDETPARRRRPDQHIRGGEYPWLPARHAETPRGGGYAAGKAVVMTAACLQGFPVVTRSRGATGRRGGRRGRA